MFAEFDLSSPPLASLNIQNYLFLDDNREGECILSALGEETDSFTSGSSASLRYRVEFRGTEVSITSIEAEPHFVWHKHMSSEEASTMYNILERGVLPNVLVDIVQELEVNNDILPVLLVRSGQPDTEVDVLLQAPPEPVSKVRNKVRGKEVRSSKGKQNGKNAAKVPTNKATAGITSQASSPQQPQISLPSPIGISSEFDLHLDANPPLHIFDTEDWCSEDLFQHMSGLLSPAPQPRKGIGRPRTTSQSKGKAKLSPATTSSVLSVDTEPPQLQHVPSENDIDFADDWFDFSGAEFNDYDVLSPTKSSAAYSQALEGMESALDPTPQHRIQRAPVFSKEADVAAFVAKHLPVNRSAINMRRLQDAVAGSREHQKLIKVLYDEHYTIYGDYESPPPTQQRVILPLQLINLKITRAEDANPYRLSTPDTLMKSFERFSYYDNAMARWIDKPSPLLTSFSATTDMSKFYGRSAQATVSTQQAPKQVRKKTQLVNPDDPAPKRKKYTKRTDKGEISPRSGTAGVQPVHPTFNVPGMWNGTAVKLETKHVPINQQTAYYHYQQQQAAGHFNSPRTALNPQTNNHASSAYDSLRNQQFLHRPQDAHLQNNGKGNIVGVDEAGSMVLPGLHKDFMPIPEVSTLASSRGGSKRNTGDDARRKGSKPVQGSPQTASNAALLAQKLKEQDRAIAAAAEKVLSMNSSSGKAFDTSLLLPGGAEGGHLQGLLSSGMTPRLQQHTFPLTQNPMAFQPTTVYPYSYQQPTSLPMNVKNAVNTIGSSGNARGYTAGQLLPQNTPDSNTPMFPTQPAVAPTNAYYSPPFQQREYRSNSSI